MFSLRSLLAIAPLAALAYAQSKVAFTSLPASLDVGTSFNITWAGGDGSPVTLTLRRGNPNDLDTVTTIASNLNGYWYNWNVPSTLQSGADYAFQITQGQSDINWTGLFSINGATASNATSTAASTTRAGNSTAVMTSMGSASGTGTAMQRNTTFSSASLTSQGAFTFSESATTTRSSSSRTSSASASATSAPSNAASAMAGSSAALIMGLVAAMMLH